MPGEHASPTGGGWSAKSSYPAYRVDLIAPYGPEATSIGGGGERFMTGSSNAWTTIAGCTLRDFRATANYTPALGAILFTNCAFSGEVTLKAETTPGFGSCVFLDCRMDMARRLAPGDAADEAKSATSAAFLLNCHAEGSVFSVASTNAPKPFAAGCDLRDCYAWAANATRLAVSTSFRDCTVVCPSAWDIDGQTSAPASASGSLLGVTGTNGAAVAWGTLTGSVATNAEAVAAALGADFRPAVTNWRYRYVGYGSAAERALRDSMLESIRAALGAAAD